MVRHYIRKSKRANQPKEAFAAAAHAHANGMSIRKAAELNGIPVRTLARYIPILKKNKNSIDGILFGYKKTRQIIGEQLEQDMVEYAKKAARIFHGISVQDLRRLAYEIAIANKLENIPEKWIKEKTAGIDWAQHFLKRHTDIAIRQPEPTSIQRLTNFNPHNVKVFMDNLEQVLSRPGGFGPDQDAEIETSFLRRTHASKVGNFMFIFPDEEDISTHLTPGIRCHHEIACPYMW